MPMIICSFCVRLQRPLRSCSRKKILTRPSSLIFWTAAAMAAIRSSVLPESSAQAVELALSVSALAQGAKAI